ncbi:MAG TPA: glycosyl hydrolase family 28 protein [Polyangia bacterium]|nr:glycosyl hydrolase family 28 protein [Polyangia bacterium]
MKAWRLIVLSCVLAGAVGCALGNPAVGEPRDLGVGDDGATPDLGASDLGARHTGVYLLYETFNAMPTGSPPGAPWTASASGGASVLVREIPFAADKSAELAKPGAAGLARLSTTFAAQSGRVVFEAKVKARETAGFKAIPYVYDASGNAVASVAFQDGNIIAHVGGTISTLQTFAADVWYRVRVVVDTNHGTFDLYVDGVRVAAGQALRTPSPSVSSVGYFIDGTNVGTLYVDNVKVYNEADYIGAAPAPVFDARAYGAAGDGTTKDTAAIQAAIDAAAGTGGSVLLSNGRFLSGTLTLKSGLTFFIDPSAVLVGSAAAADYPQLTPNTGNTQLSNCQRALLYAPQTAQLTIDGGGTIDGQGDSFSGVEATRPMIIWAVLSNHVTVQNLYLRKGAVWSLVSMESDQVLINNVNIQSDGITHDGIDVVDGQNVTVQECAVRSGDDAMCLKSGVRRGIDTMVVRNSFFGGSGTSGGSNGIKFGTATYGAFKNVTIEDSYVKDVQYAAMAVESRQGADVGAVAFNRIELADAGAAFFVYLAQQSTTHPAGDVPKLGSIDGVSFTDVAGSTASWANSPHQGSLVTGHVFNGTTYPITNLSFSNVAVTFDGGRATVPAAPPEATPNQYPESNMFGDLPAWGYYLRHVAGVTFSSCASTAAATDARQKLVTDDVTGLTGAP